MIRVSGSISSRLGCALLLSACLASCTNPSTSANQGPVVTHTALTTPQPAGQAVTLTATVEDPDGVASVTVFYQVAHASAWQTVSLQEAGVRSTTYTGEIPAAGVVAPSISYYFAATDRKGATATLPVAAPTEAFSFTVTGETGDTEGPVISHVPVANDRVLGTPVQIRATVNDASGVASVVCHYRAPGAAAWEDLPLAASGTNGTYEASLPNGAVVPPSVEYWLEAVDLDSPTPHTSTLPKNAPDTAFSFTVSPGDDQPPVITHTPVGNGQPESRPVPVTATVDDQTGIAANGVKLYYRVAGGTDWTSLTMTQANTSSPWVQTIPASAVTTAGVDYYIEAKDSAPMGNIATHPADAPTGFHTFTTAPETCVVPPIARESFEGGILPGWWREYHSGVTGCGWTVSTARPHDGSYGVQHGWSGNCNDVLVLPCLDLTTAPAEGLVFDWWQYEEDASAAQSHTLEYAFDNPDPSQTPGYVAFTPTLPVEQAAGWVHRSVLIPPTSPIMGHAKVYLALRYIGSSADRWTVDEIQIRPPQPVMEFAAIETTPNPIVPSGTAGTNTDVALTVKLRNVGDKTGPALTGVLSMPTTDPKITITTDTGSFPACPAGGETAANQFRLTVDGSHSQTSVALKVHVNELNVDIPIDLYIGARATAHVKMTTSALTWESDVDLFLGYGADPVNPTWNGTRFNGNAGTSGSWTYDIDISAQMAHLPPSVTNPWFLRIDHNYSGSCVIDDFTIFYGTNSYKAQGIPFSAPGDKTSYIQLPMPPNLKVDGIVTTPATLAPGTTGAALTVTLRNDGAATTAALTGTLAPKDAATAAAIGASLNQTTPHAFGAGPLVTGQKIAGDPWTFDVATAFNDGKPLSFVLTLTDGTATWLLDVAVPVPWPGVSVESVNMTATDNGNFLPDPGETVDFTVDVQNSGSGPTAGVVTGDLTLAAENTASVTLAFTHATFGSGAIPAGSQAIGSSTFFRIQVGAGALAHQTIVLNLTLSDGTTTWVRKIVLPIYAQVAGTDPLGDDGAAVVDLRQLYVHVADGVLRGRVVGWTAFDAALAQVSLIVAEPAGGSGKTFRLRWDAGVLSAATLESTGWVDVATTPASLAVDPVSGLTAALVFRIALADMTGLTLPGQARFGAQADGTGTTVHDYFPDAWSSRSPSDLVTVSWP
ncbi:MAG TPA: hypothetical protein VGQ83_09670 [Polyangia bacterium]